ncbi:oligoendopeptidase, pepF/M3 family [Caloramator quimbayensis]|uniref:Oligoendopeptidase, pepF/M3 family n=1 Tax=Caloramator quimbayensis TaxID=1147123 RepID=A0A1T4WGC6_9CLOT|nr:M3 family oligoendopeptidase [Caloramator quimbayensis]SKA76352.1 oligoendopeptidase, pepF/M3 family [Caloramator quimbayensis]
MNMRWSLDDLYTSYDSKEFLDDLKLCDEKINEFINFAENLDNKDTAEAIKKYIEMSKEFGHLYSRLTSYVSLILSVDVNDTKALNYLEKLEDKITSLTKPQVEFQRWLKGLENLDEIISKSNLLKEHEFFIKEVKEKSNYLLDTKEEVIISKMKTTGSMAWAKLQENLISNHTVEITIDGAEKSLPLPVVRNMAYEKDASLRKNAYEAELKSYEKIAKSSAACLNGIKGEVITLCKLRGYKSPLDKTLEDSRLDRDTLFAMLEAMKESLPYFRKYLKKKAEILGHKNGLPFYDLFAPVGNADMKFTYDEAREFIVENFKSFSPKLSKFIDNAFENRWIDAEPRKGKQSGAFCANLHCIGQSRIMANFTGSFNDMSTLAHELGHAFHGSCLADESYLNSEYPMPLAETASIFNETIVTNAALEKATKDEALSILENGLQGSTQVIVDILSRYIFETELFRRREESSLSVEELKEIMLDAQRQTYGDGLDENYLHPYMWVCKPHYYYADCNFYNFPYAFGELFAKGLYAEYVKRGSSFFDDYENLLKVTGKMKVRDVALIMGIDIHSVDFWRSSLNVIKKDIEKFISLV